MSPVQEIASGGSSSGKRVAVEGLPASPRIQWAKFSPKGNFFSFVHSEPEGLSLWVVDLARAKASRVTPSTVSAVLDFPYQWLPDESGLLVHVRPSTEAFVAPVELPAGPIVKEAAGRKAPARTYQDLLKSKADERTFSFYATTEVRRFSLDGAIGRGAAVLAPAIRRSVLPSPDGRFLLVTTILEPFTYRFPVFRFAYRTEIHDAAGAKVATLVEKPVQDSIPIAFDATETGRREFAWRDDAPATVFFVEAQDGGDPANDVPFRDHLFLLDAPFDGAPRPFAKTRNRFAKTVWGEGGVAILTDFRWKDRNTKTYLANATGSSGPNAPIEPLAPKVLFDLSSENLYALPGDFVTAPDSRGRPLLRRSRDGRRFFLAGEGYSAEGNRPFLDAFELATGKTTRLWRADGKETYEPIVRVLDPERGLLLTRVEGSKTYPNFQLRDVKSRTAPRRLTSFENPFQPLAAVTSRKIRYQRADGVELAGDLHLPPGYDAGERRPAARSSSRPTRANTKTSPPRAWSTPHHTRSFARRGDRRSSGRSPATPFSRTRSSRSSAKATTSPTTPSSNNSSPTPRPRSTPSTPKASSTPSAARSLATPTAPS